MYLGDGRQCGEFAKQFLEKRSKWRSAQRPQVQADDLCKPAPAVNPNACTEFQEVKVNCFNRYIIVTSFLIRKIKRIEID